MTAPLPVPSDPRIRADLGGGRRWESQSGKDYGWLLNADDVTFGYPLTLEEAISWTTPDWPPGRGQ